MVQNEEIKVIDGDTFRKMCYGALNKLKDQQSYIDSLNVFPVPDGDTGTNMLLTFQEAVENIEQSNSNRIDNLTKALSKGALMGARGNSGVILSQLLRGFSEANKYNKTMDNSDLIKSLSEASRIAYQGVLKPVEGTILTVARKAARKAEKLEDTENTEELLRKVIDAAHKALNKTPDQLPQLKEAGVVDAGGQGYLTILEGMLAGLTGKEQISKETTVKKETKEEVEELKYGYCTQTLINVAGKNVDIDEIKDDIEQFGDSLMVVGDEEIIKIHKIDEIIFASNDISSKSIIKLMLELPEKNIDYKIAPPESLSVIGSSSINSAGNIYMVEFNSVTKAKNKRTSVERIFAN